MARTTLRLLRRLAGGLLPHLGLAAFAAAQTDLWTVTRVVDGDTIHVRRGERTEKLRLLNLDTEEKRSNFDSGKPQTDFGDVTAAYVRRLFHCDDQGTPLDAANPPTVRLEFEGAEEERGTYGRLLCYVHLGETNLAEHLIRAGYSPYYTKYGFSRRHHERFLAAEAEARARGLGIWDERTNAGAARNDYAVLKAWWDTRARAMLAFERARGAGDYSAAIESDRKRLQEAAGGAVRVFGAVWSITIERRVVRVELEGSAERPVQLVFPHDMDRTRVVARLMELAREGGNDFVIARGRVVPARRAIEVHVDDPERDVREAPVAEVR